MSENKEILYRVRENALIPPVDPDETPEQRRERVLARSQELLSETEMTPEDIEDLEERRKRAEWTATARRLGLGSVA